MVLISGDIFKCIQQSGLFKDSKTFVDAVSYHDESEINKAFKALPNFSHRSLSKFIKHYFILPRPILPSQNQSKHFESLSEYISNTWKILMRRDEPVKKNRLDTKLSLPSPYIVPGGRFRELYYWDTYFTALGLSVQGYNDVIKNLIKNFIFLQNKFGLIPNANRLYYLSRSQPPVLVLLIDLLYSKFGINEIKMFLPALEKEHIFWVNKRLAPLNGTIFSRYCDPEILPRPESYKEDTMLAQSLSDHEKQYAYQAIRSAAESGWDFSSRWMREGTNLKTIYTQAIIPLDLNALLYILESKLADYYTELGDTKKMEYYRSQAVERKEKYNAFFWHATHHCYYDYDIESRHLTNKITAAISWPLFAKIATRPQAEAIKEQVEHTLLEAGGVVTTRINSGEQWDYPNGWPPLQWVTVKGLLNYGFNESAYRIISRWCQMMERSYQRNHVVLEKYNVCNLDVLPDQGEYEVQEGYGWSNGVYLMFKSLLKEV